MVADRSKFESTGASMPPMAGAYSRNDLRSPTRRGSPPPRSLEKGTRSDVTSCCEALQQMVPMAFLTALASVYRCSLAVGGNKRARSELHLAAYLRAFLTEGRTAAEASQRYIALRYSDPTELALLGIGREDIARSIFEEFYTEEAIGGSQLSPHWPTADLAASVIPDRHTALPTRP